MTDQRKWHLDSHLDWLMMFFREDNHDVVKGKVV